MGVCGTVRGVPWGGSKGTGPAPTPGPPTVPKLERSWAWESEKSGEGKLRDLGPGERTRGQSPLLEAALKI